MGTSGSYGGSGKKPWRDARQQVLDLPSDSSSSADSGGETELDPPSDALSDLWETIGDALDSDDPSLHAPTLDEPDVGLPKLMPWLSAGTRGSGGGGGGGVAAVRTGGGRSGSGSRRRVVRGAARGGTALGAAYAVRRGDSAYLDELGLSLASLRTLSPVRQCAEILDAVLGEESHPDEQALRKASLETLKAVLADDQPPNELTAVRSFVVEFVFELALVELQRQVNEGALSAADVMKKEKMVRGYLERRVLSIDITTGSDIRPRDLRFRAAVLTKEAIKVLRAGSSGKP